MKQLSVYEIWQSEKFGTIIPETPDNTSDSKDWFETQNEIRELDEQGYDQ